MRHWDPIVVRSYNEAMKRLEDVRKIRGWRYSITPLLEVNFGERKAWIFFTPFEKLALADTGQVVRAEELKVLEGEVVDEDKKDKE